MTNSVMAPCFPQGHKACLTCQAKIQELEEDTEGLRRVARGPCESSGAGEFTLTQMHGLTGRNRQKILDVAATPKSSSQ